MRNLVTCILHLIIMYYVCVFAVPVQLESGPIWDNHSIKEV